MDIKILYVVFASIFAVSYGVEPSNYDISRNKLGSGGGYGQYPNYPGQYPGNYPSNPGLYPSGPGYPGQYPGSNYPSNYPGSNYPVGHNPGLVGPPGAHPGCPLCDSSVYSYCSQKQAHDACCCENPSYLPYSCRKTNCKFIYANTCQEYQLISNCCCVDVQKNSVSPTV